MSTTNTPCAACKCLRRKCTQECVFAPYFPPDNPQKFTNVHKVFGASNVAKILNDLNVSQREECVKSLAYEAEYRLKDPIYGCVGLISILQHRLKQIQMDTDTAKRELAAFIGPSALLPIITHPLVQQNYAQPLVYEMMPLQVQQMLAANMGPQQQGIVIHEPHQQQHHLQQQQHQQNLQQQQQQFIEQQQSAALAREQEMMRAFAEQQEHLHRQNNNNLERLIIINDGLDDDVSGASGFNQVEAALQPTLELGGSYSDHIDQQSGYQGQEMSGSQSHQQQTHYHIIQQLEQLQQHDPFLEQQRQQLQLQLQQQLEQQEEEQGVVTVAHHDQKQSGQLHVPDLLQQFDQQSQASDSLQYQLDQQQQLGITKRDKSEDSRSFGGPSS